MLTGLDDERIGELGVVEGRSDEILAYHQLPSLARLRASSTSSASIEAASEGSRRIRFRSCGTAGTSTQVGVSQECRLTPWTNDHMPEVSLPIRRLGVLVKILVRERTEDGNASPVGPIQAYLDTGASDTMLDGHVLSSLNLEPLRSTSLSVLGREESSFHDLYAVEVAVIVPGETLRWVAVDALAGAVYQTGGLAALGRDFLAHVELSYDGPRKRAVVRW